jgi:uncharacterized protein
MSAGTNWIQTYNGYRVNPLNLTGDEVFDIRDIAHASSLICRFTGHIERHYSVAQHSVYVMQVTAYFTPRIDLQMAALLHDAEEVYLNDLAQPIKRQMSRYRTACRRVRRAIFQQHGLRPSLTDHALVKDIDGQVLRWEAEEFFPIDAVAEWNLDYPDDEIMNVMPRMSRWSPVRAERAFLHAYDSLKLLIHS